MRKVTAGLFSSIDGVVESPDQWQPAFDDEMGAAGSPSLVRSLIEQGLLDELTLMISPVVAGGGRKRLFADDAALTKFDLVEAQGTSSGAVIATYRPVR